MTHIKMKFVICLKKTIGLCEVGSQVLKKERKEEPTTNRCFYRLNLVEGT